MHATSRRTLRVTAVLVLAALASVAACAPRAKAPAVPDPIVELATARALVADGCYTCLERALAIALRVLRAAPAGPAHQPAFDAAVLLAIRDRELGARERDHLPQAEALAAERTDDRTRVLIEVLRALPWPAAAVGVAEADASLVARSGMRDTVRAWHERLLALGGDDWAAHYLAQTLRCERPHVFADAQPEAPGASDVPLFRFRSATCGRTDGEALASLREAVPAFSEVDYFIGLDALNRGTLLTAERHLAASLEAHPPLLPASLHLARALFMLEEFEAALPHYERILAVVNDQVDARLGRGRALGHLGRHAEAIDAFSGIIASGSWHLGDAHYWRGWNRFHLGDLAGADEDAEAARRLMVNARVHKLSGGIAAAREHWPAARREFEAALALDESDCDIPLSLATVLGRERAWSRSAALFTSAAACLADLEASYERRLAEIQSAEMGDARRQRMAARARAARDGAHAQQGLAYFNAAVACANAGARAESLVHARRAAEWPEWAGRAAEIIRKLDAGASAAPH